MPGIDVKAAVGSAHNYLQSIKDLMGGTLENLRLEEVELSDDERTWSITLGFDVPDTKSLFPELARAQSLTLPYKREYKLFQVDAKTGLIKSMKIREP